MIDVQAQTDVVTHPYFHSFLDVTKSYELIENIVAASVRKVLLKNLSRAEKFTSLGGNCQKKVQVGHLQTISGTQAIAEYGPSTKILAAVNSNTDLSSIFFRLLPIELFEDIARESKRQIMTFLF